MTEDVDVQAFMTGQSEIEVQFREALTPQLEFAGAEATEFVLSHVANVSYRGDDKAYLEEVMPIVSAALLLALQPTFDRLRRETDASKARAKRLEEDHATFLREFEEFRQMRTSPTAH